MAQGLGTPRGEFIASVRRRLGRRAGAPDSPYPALGEELASLEERGRQAMRRLQEGRGALMARMAATAELRGWRVCRAANSEEALDYLRETIQGLSARLAVRSHEEVFRETPVDDLLAGMGVRVQVMARGDDREGGFDPASADVGITGADYAIAETGTVVLVPRRGVSRLVSLLPPVHVALVRGPEVVEGLDDLYLFRRLEYHRRGGDMGSYMNFVTGPSRTADIEQTLVIGAHGPRETHMIILEG